MTTGLHLPTHSVTGVCPTTPAVQVEDGGGPPRPKPPNEASPVPGPDTGVLPLVGREE